MNYLHSPGRRVHGPGAFDPTNFKVPIGIYFAFGKTVLRSCFRNGRLGIQASCPHYRSLHTDRRTYRILKPTAWIV
jgi:hypothetical protein